MKLLVVRHGQTDANANKLLQGSKLDPPLNETGILQAKGVLPLLKGEKIDALYSSQLQRAYQTAAILAAELKLEIQTTHLLNEKNYGDFTGKSWEQVHREFDNQELRKIDRSHAYDYRPHGGESVDDVKKRVETFLAQAQKSHPGQTIVAVTHGGILRLLHHLLEVEEPPHIENASLHTFSL